MNKIVAGLLLFVVISQTSFAIDMSILREGDIIFQESGQSESILRATNSNYSHVGIILKKNEQLYVFEAASTVGYTPVESWINGGVGGRYAVKRLDNADKILTSEAIAKIHQVAASYEGKPYDIYFEWSDDKMYCSELVWKIFKNALGIEVGRQQKFKDFNLSDPLVQAKLKERFGDNLPLEDTVIAPQAIWIADNLGLITIYPDTNISKTAADNKLTSWTPLKIDIYPTNICFPNKPNIYGLDIGPFVAFAENRIYGIQFALVCTANEVRGLQIGPIGADAGMMHGIQMSGWASFARELHGIQFSILGNNLLFGAAAKRKERVEFHVTGIQIGLFNYADSIKGIQIGLINTIRHGGIFPTMIGLNAGF